MRWLALLWVAIGCLVALMGCDTKGNDVQEIKFDLGKNIVETARTSGVPQFSVSNVAGLIGYSVNQIPAEIVTRYTRPGYEVAVAPLFSFRLNADHDLTPNDLVDSVTLQFDTRTLKTHETAQAFVEQLIGQFQKGKWKRYIDDTCPAVTGRSSLLDTAGNLDTQRIVCPDPAYKMTREEWLTMLSLGQWHRWVGDGIFAELSVSGGNGSDGISYRIFLRFEDYAVKKNRDEQAEAYAIKNGEANGWGTAAKHAKAKVATAERNKILEANAIKRGDAIVPRD
jgi:hypothetical protein